MFSSGLMIDLLNGRTKFRLWLARRTFLYKLKQGVDYLPATMDQLVSVIVAVLHEMKAEGLISDFTYLWDPAWINDPESTVQFALQLDHNSYAVWCAVSWLEGNCVRLNQYPPEDRLRVRRRFELSPAHA